MRRSRGKFSDDELDQEIQGHVTTARRSLGRAVDVCVRARRGQPRHLNRAAYKRLMEMLTAAEQIRSVVPAPLEDPDLYPVELKDRVQEIESYVRQANHALRVAEDMMRRAEDAFNEAGATFAGREIAAVESTEAEVRSLIASLEGYRGLRPDRRDVEREPIRRERQREPRARRTAVPVAPHLGPPGE